MESKNCQKIKMKLKIQLNNSTNKGLQISVALINSKNSHLSSYLCFSFFSLYVPCVFSQACLSICLFMNFCFILQTWAVLKVCHGVSFLPAGLSAPVSPQRWFASSQKINRKLICWKYHQAGVFTVFVQMYYKVSVHMAFQAWPAVFDINFRCI